MTPLQRTLAAALASLLLLSARAADAPVLPAPTRTLHPDIALLDAQGRTVLASGQAVSTLKTCGQCHDASYITSHSSHGGSAQAAGLDPVRALQPQGMLPAEAELNCFLCHIEQPDHGARNAALRGGRPADAATATLSALPLVAPAAGGGWAWNRSAFTPEGLVRARTLGLQDPTDANCGACHGEVHAASAQPLQLQPCDPTQPVTASSGQVFAAQRISASGLNLAGKAALRRPWDIHAERQLSCTSCHHAANNPAHARRSGPNTPAHLRRDPRTLDIGQYLTRPDHRITRSAGRCDSCHDAAIAHARWLPYVDTHLRTLACESCHVPRQVAPALQLIDWTVLDSRGQPQLSCRGLDGPADDLRTLISGFQPVLLPHKADDGAVRLAPYNLLTRFHWVADDAQGRPQAVPLPALKAAWLDGDHHAAAVVQAFDRNGDGRLDAAELRIDTPARAAFMQSRLQQQGLKNPRIEGRVQPYAIHHGVARGEQAVNDCRACHGAGSRVAAGLPLAGFAPVVPTFDTRQGDMATGVLQRAADGALHYQPAPARDGVYVFGASRVAWVDAVGAAAFIGTLLGVTGHALLRLRAWRQRPPAPTHTHPVRMYDAYRRFWHWLQAVGILALLATGLVVHRPDLFGALSFSGAVTLHNVLAAVVVANAALALFYHLATDRLREYLPRPYGFFDDSIRQARYYLSGIFKGEPHPFEKRPDDRMNPIQKATYFGILNVLLPLQVASGALIWGLQRWPDLAQAVGGLPLLGPLHSLVAWLFATFIVGHVYLTTTGPTPLEGLRGMVTGVEAVEDHAPTA